MVYTLNGVNYTRRKRIVITGAASGAQTNFQLKLAAAYAAAMQSDFDDLRFSKADMQTLIDAWLESKSDGSSADVWAEFPTTPANTVEQTYYMYYGKADAVNYWDGDATFLHFSHFDSDLSDFGTVGTPTIVGSDAVLNDDDKLYPLSGNRFAVSEEIVIETYAKITERDAAVIGMFEDSTVDNTLLVYSSDASELPLATNLDSQTAKAGSADIAHNTISDNPSTEFRKYKIERLTDEINYYQSEVLLESDTTTAHIPIVDMGFGVYVWDSSMESTLYLDYMFIRKYAVNPPTYEFGSEEHQRRTPQFM